MIRKLEIYLDNEWIDYTNNLEANNIVRQSRCDEVFATGSLQIRCSRSTNIPPYTPLRINESEYWLCSSKCKKYLTLNDYYIHNVDLLELTAILSCYILGSKAFSTTGKNKQDWEKMVIINDIIKQKYNVIFNFKNIESIFTKEQEFIFGPGTTVYDAILEIVKSYDGVKVKAATVDVDTNTYGIEFQFDNSEYVLNNNYIIDEYTTQQSNDYGAILESEMTNVIDRTNTILVKDLTLRSDNAYMTADNSYLKLPTKVEEVVNFEVSDLAKLEAVIYLNEEYNDYLKSIGFPTEEKKVIQKTFPELIDIFKDFSFNPIDYVYKNVLIDYYEIDKDYLQDAIWNIQYINTFIFSDLSYVIYPYDRNQPLIINSKFQDIPTIQSLKDVILPKSKWDLLLDKEKPKYVYYESGSNKIEGMNNYYNTGIWEQIVGGKVYPFLYYKIKRGERSKYETLSDGTEIYLKWELNLDETDNATDFYSLNHSYNIEYYPITDPFASSKKTVIPINENKVKDLAKSYDKSSNFIDFDRMIDSLGTTNNMMGMPELCIEYIVPNTQELPKAYQEINRMGRNWVIASVIIKSNLKQTTALINLVSDYNKVAEAIGVKTQYNATKNPLENIITRPIFFEQKYNQEIPNTCWIKVEIWSDNFYKELYKRVAVMKKGKITYVYFEALDQYSFDKQAVRQNADIYSCNDIPYSDNNNEAKYVQLTLLTLPELTREESLKLPIYKGSQKMKFFTTKIQRIYKDAREKLTFTIIIEKE